MRFAKITLSIALLATCSVNAQQVAITHGPILGRLSHDGVGVWARTSRPGAFVVRYGENPTSLDQLCDATATNLEHDNTGWVHLTDLDQNTKYSRECDIRWSTFFRSDIPRHQLTHPALCVVQVNNVFNNPQRLGETRWVAFERPQVIFQYHDGRSGDLMYAEAIPAVR